MGIVRSSCLIVALLLCLAVMLLDGTPRLYHVLRGLPFTTGDVMCLHILICVTAVVVFINLFIRCFICGKQQLLETSQVHQLSKTTRIGTLIALVCGFTFIFALVFVQNASRSETDLGFVYVTPIVSLVAPTVVIMMSKHKRKYAKNLAIFLFDLWLNFVIIVVHVIQRKNRVIPFN